jgi:hypothetical protein
LGLLEQFVVDNEDLLALESLIGRFNIFDALRVARTEIRHSNFLAFILNPAESHGLGELFLRAVLMDILRRAPVEARSLSPIELDGAALRGVEIRREWEHLDLLITCHDPRFAIVIENKVDATEHSDQLGRYRREMAAHFPDLRPLYLYLSPNSASPSDTGWVPYGYSDIHRVLTRVRNTYHGAIGGDVLSFLDHYLSLIGTQFMDDPAIDALCRRIYTNHRRALDLIFERVAQPGSSVLAEAETAVRQDERFHVFNRGRNVLEFVPKAWLEWMPAIGLDQRDEPRSWLILRFELFPGELDYHVELRQIQDQALRRELVAALLANATRLGFKQKKGKVTGRYTRVSGRERLLGWKEDQEPDPAKIREIVHARLNATFEALKPLPEVLRPIFAHSQGRE